MQEITIEKSYIEEMYNLWSTVNKKEISKREKENLGYLSRFVRSFPISEIKKIKLEDYVIKNSDELTFCNWVEKKLFDLGNIQSSELRYFQKFGISYKEDLKEYVICRGNAKKSKFGSNYKEAFDNIKKEIYNLLQSTKKHDLKAIEQNKLNPLFKNKLTYLYFRNEWIPIYSDDHLNVLLTIFGINFDINEDRLYKRIKLFEFMKKLTCKDITPLRFMWFIYSESGFKYIIQSKKTMQFLKSKKEYDLVNINVFDKHTDINTTSNGLVSINPNFEIIKKIIGRIGENIVKKFLLDNAKRLKIKNLKFKFEINDSAHYDISYENEDGDTIFIEVKSTSRNYGNKVVFEMSSGEYDFMCNHIEKYFVYYINDIYHSNKILRLPGTMISVKPSKYIVELEYLLI